MKTFYHNITKHILNETDLLDFVASVEEGDALFYTRAGDANMYILTEEQMVKINKLLNRVADEAEHALWYRK